MELFISLIFLVAFLATWYVGISFIIWSVLLVINIAIWFSPPILFWIVYIPIHGIFLVPSLRKKHLTDKIVEVLKKYNLLPNISETEKTALRAGTVWVDGEIFSGKPNFNFILNEAYPHLRDDEKAFLENEVDVLCAMTDDDKVFKKRDLDKKTWKYMKDNHFFGMVIPKEYGGLGFSALGHSAVVQKLASRSQVLAITAMVPNSIGPAELILEHGTQEQKDHYLPRLADGRDLPCFALTEPLAGSDATSISSIGKLFKAKDGSLEISLDFDKRYITLGSVATVLGLAFVLRDPDNLLGGGEDLGITFALVSSDKKGLDQGKRHDPLGVPFINSPVRGKDVIISIDDIIGGQKGIGEGWKMLMESLSVGRGISLPSTGSGGIKLTARVAGAYTMIREQFGIPVARFEGIKYELAQMAGFAYMMDAARIYTIGAIDNGKKPAVVNAVMKYHATEIFRDVVNSGMDVLGGAGIILGKKNLIGHAYMGAPIAITVEGANIMTRTLIQFGQGVIRCHPYAYEEIEALERGDNEAFDNYFWKHVGFTFTNATRMCILSLTRGYAHVPHTSGILAYYERKLAWSSATFAFLTDLVMAYYGGGFKQKEMLSARFGDLLSWMYLLMATMRRFEAEGKNKKDEVYLRWVGDYALHQIQTSFEEIFANLGSGPVRWFFNGPVRWFARINSIGKLPSDDVYKKVSDKLLTPGNARDDLTEGIYLPDAEHESLYKIEKTLLKIKAILPIKAKIKIAIKAAKLKKAPKYELYSAALDIGVITKEEYKELVSTEKESEDIIQVDEYTDKDYLSRKC
ncbi:MAG: acyl-CoA dehydrogenase [Sulfurimonas sp.]|nr:acyl-CoA dehydrogenase [Sulfurimonas sp.]